MQFKHFFTVLTSVDNDLKLLLTGTEAPQEAQITSFIIIMDEYSDKLKGLLAATHEYYRLVVDLQNQYEIVLKSKAVANPLSKSNESFSGEPIDLLKYSLAMPTTLKTKLRKPFKRNVLGKKTDTKIALKAGLKVVLKILDLRYPRISQQKLSIKSGVISHHIYSK